MAAKKGSAARELRRGWDSTRRGETAGEARDRATFHLPSDLLNEVRNAVVALSGPPHQLTMSKFAAIAFHHELESLKRQGSARAQGKPFDQRQGRVRRGRPLS